MINFKVEEFESLLQDGVCNQTIMGLESIRSSRCYSGTTDDGIRFIIGLDYSFYARKKDLYVYLYMTDMNDNPAESADLIQCIKAITGFEAELIGDVDFQEQEDSVYLFGIFFERGERQRKYVFGKEDS